ncbi:unannotated protein [freshwater metagenome]|uniref:Unannotated protein n=1 Tax=freshwater metagenome TaxID=449393 RepID=A0A6J7TM78_9ZZZZ
MRLTPAATYVFIISTVTSSGLHSTVISALSVTGIAATIDASNSGARRVGVPPPKNTVSATGIPASTARAMSAITASTYAIMR